MDFLNTLIGAIALVIALVSLWQGRRSSDAIKKELAEFRRTNELLAAQSERQANHIDDLLAILRLVVTRRS